MDAKALAKSKRAHSQHHSKKSHSNQKQKPNESRKPLAKPNLLSQAAPNLLSNWDRYGEETGEDEATVHDLILPKSKGADYRHLIAEARSQMQSCITSMDDVLPRELSDGGSAMLAARGEGLLSWIEDDSFIVDETGTAIPELADEKTVCDQLSSQMQTSECQREARNIEISSVTEKVNIENGVRDATSRYFGSIHQDPTFNPSPTLSNQVHYNAHPIELDISSQTKAPKYTEQSNTKFTTGNPNEKVLKLEATTAEAELDMLLSSFSDTIDLNTAAASSSSRIDEVFKASPHLPNKGSYSTKKAPVAAELDDALDELLQDTSYLISHKEKPVNSQIQSLSPHSGTNSIPNDDFDSWLDSI
ncbi:uncharacterized protein LOC120083819 isoform X2 [Benincasa hispida]|uniref:uncharacterized protein LOC120083819 isoform X2 n=1 Tax=Benincasa hispida TaxID=102211 RepID=UPI001901363F|nr:uncharacterized protein LOC120083819 isoform X2 [Benincasa hispida]